MHSRSNNLTRVNGSKLHSQDFDADGAQNCTKSTVGQTSPPNKDTKFSHLYDFSLYECMIKILSSAGSSFLEKNKIKNPSCKFWMTLNDSCIQSLSSLVHSNFVLFQNHKFLNALFSTASFGPFVLSFLWDGQMRN